VGQSSASVTGLAGRYATALFELAVEAEALDAVAGDLATLDQALAECADLARLVRSPVLSRAAQRRALDAILERVRAHDLTRRFVGLLAEHRRLFALADIITDFSTLLAAHRGEVRAEVRTPVKLGAKQLGAVRAALKKAIGGEVAVEQTVDESLLGGLVVRVGSRMLDASLKTKLQRLHLAMKGIG